jgi:hypothetical protein
MLVEAMKEARAKIETMAKVRRAIPPPPPS